MTPNDLHFKMCGAVAVIRPAKRNAPGDALILALRNLFDTLPSQAKTVVGWRGRPLLCRS